MFQSLQTRSIIQSFFKLLFLLLCFVVIVSCGLSFGTKPASAQAFFESPQQFEVKEACNAVTSIRRQTEAVSLTVGASYKALGENKLPGATHTYIEVDGARKWVPLNCGNYLGDFANDGQNNIDSISFLPFFDTINNPIPFPGDRLVDITPPSPKLNDFDKAVATLCGLPGKRVTEIEFVDMMNRFPNVLKEIKNYTGGKVFASRPVLTSDPRYLRDLTEAWFSQAEGFNHIFCGEAIPGDDKIGGFHFSGRYLQLQEANLAGRLPGNLRNEEVEPGETYTMGVVMLVNGVETTDTKKGYGLTLSAEDILKIATKAFGDNPTSNSNSTACLLDVTDDGADFNAVFVRRRIGVRTFYPDATPDNSSAKCDI
jgi:Bacterial EndoU nuclease